LWAIWATRRSSLLSLSLSLSPSLSLSLSLFLSPSPSPSLSSLSLSLSLSLSHTHTCTGRLGDRRRVLLREQEHALRRQQAPPEDFHCSLWGAVGGGCYRGGVVIEGGFQGRRARRARQGSGHPQEARQARGGGRGAWRRTQARPGGGGRGRGGGRRGGGQYESAPRLEGGRNAIFDSCASHHILRLCSRPQLPLSLPLSLPPSLPPSLPGSELWAVDKKFNLKDCQNFARFATGPLVV